MILPAEDHSFWQRNNYYILGFGIGALAFVGGIGLGIGLGLPFFHAWTSLGTLINCAEMVGVILGFPFLGLYASRVLSKIFNPPQTFPDQIDSNSESQVDLSQQRELARTFTSSPTLRLSTAAVARFSHVSSAHAQELGLASGSDLRRHSR